MIDVYWTVIPVMLVHYFASHPLGHYNKSRSTIVITLTWIWSIRLTHNYFRRENWEWGAREDWRFNDLRKQYGKHWWWVSFFSVYVSQQVSYLSTNCSIICLNQLSVFVFLLIIPSLYCECWSKVEILIISVSDCYELSETYLPL